MRVQLIHHGQSISRIIAYNALVLFVFLPGVHPFFEYLSGYAGLVFLAGLLVVMAVANLCGSTLEKLFGNGALILTLLLVAGIAVYFMYPVADGLKAVMRGSDQDDAVILGVLRLLAGENPYLDLTYFGNPSSTGFGVLLYYFPFVFFGVYSLGGIFSIGLLLAVLVRASGRVEDAGFLFFLLFSCIELLALLVVGSDLIFVGCGIAMLCVVGKSLPDSRSWSMLVFSALMCGVLASSRVNFLVLVPLFGFLLFSRWKFGSVIFIALGAVVAILPSALIYLSDPLAFTPFHLLQKAQRLMPASLLGFGAAASSALAITGFLLVRRDALFFPLAVFLALLPALTMLSIADLYLSGWELARWGGVAYLIPIVPLAAILVVQLRQASLGGRTSGCS